MDKGRFTYCLLPLFPSLRSDPHLSKCVLTWCSNMALRANLRWCHRRSKVKMLQPKVRHPNVHSYKSRKDFFSTHTTFFEEKSTLLIPRHGAVLKSKQILLGINDPNPGCFACFYTHPKRFGVPWCCRQVCVFLLLIVFTLLTWHQALVEGVRRLHLHFHCAVSFLFGEAFRWIPGPESKIARCWLKNK